MTTEQAPQHWPPATRRRGPYALCGICIRVDEMCDHEPALCRRCCGPYCQEKP